MRRFYAHLEDTGDSGVVIRGEEANHMKNVLRMQEGDEFIAINGSGTDLMCRVERIQKNVEAAIVKRLENGAEPSVKITLYQAYPKSAKMNEIVQKAVELGAAGIVPFLSKRCVKRPSGQGEKLSRVAMSAVKQCGRSVLPSVTDVQTFVQAMEMMKQHEKLIVCWEEETQTALCDVLQTDASDLGVVIGSEGGFTCEEVDALRKIGGESITLGRRILRTETAGMAVLAAIFYAKGQMRY